ncbi:MAG: hypothetical protein O7H41_04795 [Planctomycetota bacterium]|nr:hypothetical protein [Planctomycetota bacterium]
MAQGKSPAPRKARKGLARKVLINWLRYDTSIFHDSFPATESNVRRVILELERFTGCHVTDTDRFNVDKVAEWVRINAAPFAERMEPPPFVDTPLPEDDGDWAATVAAPGEPPGADEVEQIHIESSVWDKLEVSRAATNDGEDGNSPEVSEPAAADSSPVLDAPEAFLGDPDQTLNLFVPPEATSDLETEGVMAPGSDGSGAGTVGHRQDKDKAYIRKREQPPADPDMPSTAEEAERVVLEVIRDAANSSLGAVYTDPVEAVRELGAAYVAMTDSLAQLITDVRDLTGKEVEVVSNPRFQMDKIRAAIRETMNAFRQMLHDRPKDEIGEQGKREIVKLEEELKKLRGAMESQFAITAQIRGAFEKIMKERMTRKPAKMPVKKAARKPKGAGKKS